MGYEKRLTGSDWSTRKVISQITPNYKPNQIIMTNSITFNFNAPYNIRLKGTGEYAKQQLSNLEDLVYLAEQDELDAMRSDLEELERDNYYDR